LDVKTQIEKGILRCPVTRECLRPDYETGSLLTEGGQRRYPFLRGNIPVLLSDIPCCEDYVRSSERMLREYAPESLEKKKNRLHRLKSCLTQDYRSKDSREAFEELFRFATEEEVCLSVGGGPERVHPFLTNLNIGPFPNVDVVGDAHALPYGNETVDVIYCDAVLEHLSNPIHAVREMHRVLKPEGRAFVSTPFLQAYHGYPHHYHNFTLTGHRQLFTQQGFRIDAAGTCVGPTWVIVSLVSTYITTYFPRPFNVVFGKIWGLIGAGIRPLDKVLNRREDSHIMASTTFLVASKSS